MDLTNAIVYDIEVLPNVFTFYAVGLNNDVEGYFEISEYRDDREAFHNYLRWFEQTQTPMIGYNSVGYDYPIVHMLYRNPHCGYAEAYQKSKAIIDGDDRFAHTIWASDRFCPQIDLYKVNHFDNRAKSTGLKALEFAMRSESIVESSLPFDIRLTPQQINGELIPYNRSDVLETKRFAHLNKSFYPFPHLP